MHSETDNYMSECQELKCDATYVLSSVTVSEKINCGETVLWSHFTLQKHECVQNSYELMFLEDLW